jgi:hypothetical protein
MPTSTTTFTHAPVLTPTEPALKLGGKTITELCELYLDYASQLRQMKLDFFGSCWCDGCSASYESAKNALEGRIKELHKVLYPIYLIEDCLAGQPVDRRVADKAA